MEIKVLDYLVDKKYFKSIQVVETPNRIRINQFYLNIKDRNKGIGSHEMNKILVYADSVGKEVILYATSSKNKKFYRRHGFENYHSALNANMRRLPSS